MNGQLFEPREYLRPGPGRFTLAGKPNGHWLEDSYELQHLESVVRGLDPSRDSWISQAVFRKKNRRAVNLLDVGLCFADLDTYKVAGLEHYSPNDQTALLLEYLAGESLPAPSLVFFSGRGLQIKWLLTLALPQAEVHRWNRLQESIVSRLDRFGVDPAVRDVSRVLRLDRTINTKSGETCRVVWTASGVESSPARYQIGELETAFIQPGPDQDDEPAPSQKQSTGLTLPQDLNLKRLNWYRLADLRKLWQMRGGVPEGFRELTLFWELSFLVLAEPGRSVDLWKEAQALAGQIAPGQGFYAQSDLGTLWRKAQQFRAGEPVIFQGRKYPAVYTPRNRYLISLFRIEPDEQQGLLTLISSDEKRRRDVERLRLRRLADGMKPDSESASQTRPWEAFGVSRRTWYRRLKSEKETSTDLSTSLTRGTSVAGVFSAGENQRVSLSDLF